MSQLSHFCRTLKERASLQNIRFLVVAKGSKAWASTVVDAFSPYYANRLWCGEPLIDGHDSIPFKKAKLWLGRECQMLTFNGHRGIDAQALGALSGTVIGGGILLLLLPDEWFEQTDSKFDLRLGLLLQQPDVVLLEESQSLPALPNVTDTTTGPNDDQPRLNSGGGNFPYGALTYCQVGAVDAIRKVVTGHRKRPLVLTADRGRGKSAALGLAAASLLGERNINIVVTAPSYLASQTVFQHVAEQFGIAFSGQKSLKVGKGSIEFVAPDALMTELPSADLVMVDEAAAIPSPVLQPLLHAFNRLVFSSTVHGYEGTGRGFAVKFRHQLDSVMPQWRGFEMRQAIRWADNDPLEQWIFKALLLDAEIAPAGIEPSSAHYELLDKTQLLHSPALLSSLFGLLVNAHYQTSPADLVNLLDDDGLHIWLCRNGDNVLGCCLIIDEGGFSKELAEQVMYGARRPKGHLLAQSLAAHLGIADAATQRCGRILRIAVHPEFQQRGIGQQLLSFICDWARSRYDFIGTSFGFVSELLLFWQKAGYQAVRLGLQKDAASGYPSLLCVLPISERSQQWFPKASVLFASGLMSNASEAFSDLPTDELLPLLSVAARVHPVPPTLSDDLVKEQLAIYSQGGLGYELVLPSLQQYIWHQLANSTNRPEVLSLSLVVAKVIQRKSWQDIISQFQFTGRKQAEQALREIVSVDIQKYL